MSFRAKFLCACATLMLLSPSPSNAQDAEVEQAVNHAKSLSLAFRQAAAKVSPSVVTVLADTDEPQYVRGEDGTVVPYFKDNSYEDSVGSGVIIHPKGFVLTNSHVVANATRILVRLADKREFNIERVKLDKLSDVALLIIEDPPADLKAANLGNSDEVSIGDWVIAIGSPFEYATTVSAGIISGKDRSLDQIKRGKLLQTDAAINPGNSGGPLVSLDGEVIAINTAIASSSGGYQGIGFAIPSNQARWVLKQLAKHGSVRRAYLGVSIRDLKAADMAMGGIKFNEGGVVVREVNGDSPAANAGLQQGDVIVKFGTRRVRDSRDLQGFVEQQEVGTTHPVTFIRNGREDTLRITVESLPSSSDVSAGEPSLQFN